MEDVTVILKATQEGDAEATSELVGLVYDELRRLARWHIARESPSHTLDATALVNEAYVKLVRGGRDMAFDCRGKFFAAAAEAMRRILVDSARRRLAAKRGGGIKHEPFDETTVPVSKPEELLAVHEVLDKLHHHDPQSAEVVKLHYFGGFSIDEAAKIIGVSRATANRRWVYAKAWLRQAIEGDRGTD